jgi:transposase
VRCADPFHVVAWATEALDAERVRAWNQAAGRHRLKGRTNNAVGPARKLKQARWALWKNPQRLTDRQRHQLAWIAKTDPRLWRAYLLKEALRYVFSVKGDEGKIALDRWIAWARRSRLPAFIELQQRIVKHRVAIDAALDSNLSNALIESTNTKIRLLTRIAYGFHGPEPLIALAMLSLGGHAPQLPGRN